MEREGKEKRKREKKRLKMERKNTKHLAVDIKS